MPGAGAFSTTRAEVAERLQPLQQRTVGVDRDARQALAERGLDSRPRRLVAEQLWQAALLADLYHDRALTALRGQQTQRGGDRRLTDATLSRNHEQLAGEHRLHGVECV